MVRSVSVIRDPRRAASVPPPPAAGPLDLVRARVSMPISLLLLRVFLGLTFVYAGAQKLLDPGFLRAGSPDFIGTQLHGFAQGSPIAWLLHLLARAPLATGVAVAVAELAIGIGTLAAVAPRTMAGGGFALSLTLLLSATWHVHPYFLGSDSVYAVAWATYLLGYAEHERRTRAHAPLVGTGPARPPTATAMGRRELLRGGLLAGATLAAGAVAKTLSGTPAAATLAATGASSQSVQATRTPAPSGGSAGRTSPGGGGPGATAGSAVSGTPVAELASVPVGGAIGFRGPDGTPAALVRLSGGDVVAYSRVCTHAGCLVGYDPSQRILFCPCHGAEFDPTRGGAVIAGPAPRPLAEIPVRIDGATGEVVIAGT
jgi:thiosulfate dehydrogenase [quinone] large subunit